MKISLRRWVVLLLPVAILTAACQPIRFTDADLPCNVPGSELSQSQDTPLPVEVHIDGSGSMIGYVSFPVSNYVKSLETLDTILSVGESARVKAVSYYRIGQGKLSGRQDFRMARRASFYDGTDPKYPKVTSPIQSALTSPGDSDKLLFLVTDLGQDDQDATRLSKAIQDGFLNKPGYAVGVIGVRSEFSGRVYSTDPQKVNPPEFSYNTTSSSTREQRPFYILIIGPHKDVLQYVDRFVQDSKDSIQPIEATIFFPDRIIADSPTTPNVEIPGEMVAPQSLQQGQIAIEVQTPPYQVLLIPGFVKNPQTITYSLPAEPLEYGLKPVDKALGSDIQVKVFAPEQQKFATTNDPEVKNSLTLEELTYQDNKLNLKGTLNPPDRGIYLVYVDITAQELEVPVWWRRWDWQSRENDQDGSKTYNLQRFMKQLKTIPPTTGKQLLARLCFAIQRD